MLVAVRLIEERTFDLVFASLFSLATVPLELVVIVAFQRYSSNTKDISSYPALEPADFKGSVLLRKELVIVFLYADWCPFCRKSFHLLKSFDEAQLKVSRVDLSDENNPLWESLRIRTIPTLVAFKGGEEFWRANGISMVGLRKKDFKQAIAEASAIGRAP